MVAKLDCGNVKLRAGKTLCRLADCVLFEWRAAPTKGKWFNPAMWPWPRAAVRGSPTMDSVADWWGRSKCKWRTHWLELIISDPAYAGIAALPSATLDDTVVRCAQSRLYANRLKPLPALLPPAHQWFNRPMVELGYAC